MVIRWTFLHKYAPVTSWVTLPVTSSTLREKIFDSISLISKSRRTSLKDVTLFKENNHEKEILMKTETLVNEISDEQVCDEVGISWRKGRL